MTSVDDILHGEVGRGAGESAWTRPWAGEIINNPAAVTGDLFVHIPGIDPDRKFGPVGWTPVPTTEGKFYIPDGGEDCAVEFDDDRLPWLSAWIPDSGSVKLGGVVIPEPFKYPKTVTSLPSEPADGEEVNYLADATNGVVWRLKYRAGSASTHKWEFIGGPPLYSEFPALTEISSTAYVGAASLSPSLALPLAGDYDVAQGCQASGATAGSEGKMSFKNGAESTSDEDSVNQYLGGAAITFSSPTGNLARTRRKVGLGAVTLQQQYRSPSGAIINFSDRWLSAIPVRVG